MRLQGFRGNCDSLGKLGMCPSLAEPDSGGIPRRTSLRKNGLQRPAKGGSTPDRKSTRLNSSHANESRMPSSA